MERTIHKIREQKEHHLHQSIGHPSVDELIIPEELREFYSLCGGITFFKDSAFPIEIVGPNEMVLADNHFLDDGIIALEGETVRNPSWYTLADIGNGNYIAIDFSEEKRGYCYLAMWESYGVEGEMPIIAKSLKDLLGMLPDIDVDEVDEHDWFETLGDAYEIR